MEPLKRVTPATADVLASLRNSDGPSWGLLIVKEIGRPAGSVYPILERLERLGWVESAWDDDSERKGPRRRLYSLTCDGAQASTAAIAKVRARAREDRGSAQTVVTYA